MEREDPLRLSEDPGPYPAKAPAGDLELSDEQLEKQAIAKKAATDALEDGDFHSALESFSAAIAMGNATAMLYAKRAEVLLKLKRPCACISDCSSAIEINSDSAKAYRIRGKAYRRIGKWDEAHKDISVSQQLDYDDDMVDMHNFVADHVQAAKPKPEPPTFSLHQSWAEPVISEARQVEQEDEEEEEEEEEEEDEDEIEGIQPERTVPPPMPRAVPQPPQPPQPPRHQKKEMGTQMAEENIFEESEDDVEEEQQRQRPEADEQEEEPDDQDPERLPRDPKPYPAKGPKEEVELSDKESYKQDAMKQDAAEAMEGGDFKKALEYFTAAITIGNASAAMYAKRAELLLKLKRPCACISDCDSAIEINPNSARAFRTRGKAYRRLGKWEEAHTDISQSQQIDYDDDIVEMQKFVAEKRNNIFEQKRAERLKEDDAKEGRFEENLLRRRKAHEDREEIKRLNAEDKAEADAKAKREGSLRARCGACARRFRGGAPAEADKDHEDEDHEDSGAGDTQPETDSTPQEKEDVAADVD